MKTRNVLRITLHMALALIATISAPLSSYAQTKVVVVPLFGEAAKPTIYTEVAAACFSFDNVGDEWTGTFIAELSKQRADSVLEVTWSPIVEVSNVTTFNTRRVDIEILVDGQAADMQTGGEFRAIDETPNGGAPFSGSSIHSIHTGAAAGPFSLAYQLRSSGSTQRQNIVRTCNGGVMIVKEIGG